eukprot:7010055-Alexandrium_andersonii.AAC.1
MRALPGVNPKHGRTPLRMLREGTPGRRSPSSGTMASAWTEVCCSSCAHTCNALQQTRMRECVPVRA